MFQSVETLKNALAFLRGCAGSVIGHGADDPLVIAAERDFNARASRRVSDGVLDQVGEHLRQQFAIA